MSRDSIITHEAEDDLREAKAWYESRRTGLGDEFLLCVEEALERIRRIPESAGLVVQNVRRAAVRRFP